MRTERERSDEAAAIRRLSTAGQRNEDQRTQDAATVRATRLHLKGEIDLGDPDTRKILGLQPLDK